MTRKQCETNMQRLANPFPKSKKGQAKFWYWWTVCQERFMDTDPEPEAETWPQGWRKA